MIPLLALIILIVVVAVCSVAFLFAIYNAIANLLQSRSEPRSTEIEGMSREHLVLNDPLHRLDAAQTQTLDGDAIALLPGTESAARPATPVTPRSEIPEAEYPSPLPSTSPTDDAARAESPPPLTILPPLPVEGEEEGNRDSVHTIIDMYSHRNRGHAGPSARSAPAIIVTFAQAESKWAYFGQRRAESSIV